MRAYLDGLQGTALQTLHRGAAKLASAYGTASATAVSTGLSTAAFVPALTGEIYATLTGQVSHSVAGDTTTVWLYLTSGTVPAAGSAPNTGDTILATTGALASTAAAQLVPFALSSLTTGLGQGTQYAVYVAIAASAATGTLAAGAQVIAKESL